MQAIKHFITLCDELAIFILRKNLNKSNSQDESPGSITDHLRCQYQDPQVQCTYWFLCIEFIVFFNN